MASGFERVLWQQWALWAKRDWGLPYPHVAAWWKWRAGPRAKERRCRPDPRYDWTKEPA